MLIVDSSKLLVLEVRKRNHQAVNLATFQSSSKLSLVAPWSQTVVAECSDLVVTLTSCQATVTSLTTLTPQLGNLHVYAPSHRGIVLA